MNTHRIVLTIASVLFFAAFAACDSNPAAEDPADTAMSVRADDIPADPGTGRDPNTGQIIGTTGHYTLFNLRTNTIVSSSANPSPADSASNSWDLGFRSTSIIVNGGVSGPGQGAASILEGVYEDLAAAPDAGYKTDTATEYAVPAGSGNGWYNYNPQAMVLSPIPGRFLAVVTADGRYAKVRIVSYYKGAPETPNPFADLERYYTIEYVFQEDGSRQFK